MRRIYAFLAVLLALAIFLQSSRTAPSLGGDGLDDLAHTVAHFGLYFLLAWFIAGGLNATRRSPRRLFLSVILATAYGISDELHQSLVPSREASVTDLLVDLIGACLGGIAFALFHDLIRTPE